MRHHIPKTFLHLNLLYIRYLCFFKLNFLFSSLSLTMLTLNIDSVVSKTPTSMLIIMIRLRLK
ncbi:hypothetical protein MBAV_005888 [Candidatus Magnetobacterium bavaricum]|uniref:Uncharacterized protein n=1 Tax=Candidatus Magnetobacterium bavaricum TaxID=29290 RepID=A0A0F3GIY4_9BACT|nr:hypothetical protein MBAV_005888 [Candidatus Magnetobacterium bavaricum]